MIWDLEPHKVMVVLSVSFLCGILMDMVLQKLVAPGRTKYTVMLVTLVTGIFMGAYGMNLHALVCILFGQVLVFAAEYDIATHIVPDYVPVLILLIGLLEVQFAPAMLGLILVPLPFLAAALLKDGSIGGADIKLMGASGFVLGVTRGYVALMLGLLMAVLCQRSFGKEEEKAFALVPYLAFGCMMALLPV